MRPAGFSYVQGNGTSTTNGVTPFDHTSIIRTIVECFNISSGAANLTQRDANAPSLADALSLDSANMNHGLESIALPSLEATAPNGPQDCHLADIYKAMVARAAESGQ